MLGEVIGEEAEGSGHALVEVIDVQVEPVGVVLDSGLDGGEALRPGRGGAARAAEGVV